MKSALFALLLLCAAPAATAQPIAAEDYRTCPLQETERGVSVVESACGTLTPPDFTSGEINSLDDLQSAAQRRDAFARDVSVYGTCISQFINAYRRPGADATSTAPDEAACAHAWAEDQATQSVKNYGRACVDFSNRSMIDTTIEPWSGQCYPTISDVGGQG